jgi:hypothetical protein
VYVDKIHGKLKNRLRLLLADFINIVAIVSLKKMNDKNI